MSDPGAAAPVPLRIEDYALSVLLHDIGKFWERASDAPRPSPADLQAYCRQGQGSGVYTHLHAAFSGRFIAETVGIPGANLWGPRHHGPAPAGREELCAQLADWISHGEVESDESRDASAASTTALRSVLSSVTLGGISTEPRFLPLVRVDHLPEALLPKAVAPVSREDYRFHWNHFLNAIDKLGSPQRDLETWCALLDVFASRIPAASTNRQLKSQPDVDLATHSRAVAAIACALYRGPFSEKDLLALRTEFHSPVPVPGSASARGSATAAQNLAIQGRAMQYSANHGWTGRPLVRLVGLRIAGARHFLDALEGSPDPSILRGGSFFLELLSEAAARSFAGRLGLPVTSVIHRSAPLCIILVPAGAPWEVGRDALDGILQQETGTALGIEGAAVDLSLSDFRSGAARPWLALETALGDALRDRTARLARKAYDGIFGTLEEKCGRGLTESLEDLGARMDTCRFLALRDGSAAPSPSAGYSRVLQALGFPVEPFAPGDGLGAGSLDGIRAVWSLGRLELEELSVLRGKGPATLGLFVTHEHVAPQRAAAAPLPASLPPALGASRAALVPGADAVLRASVNGLRRVMALGLPAGGSGFPRILCLLSELRRLLAGWRAAEAGRHPSGSLSVIASGIDSIVLAGRFPAVVDAAVGLREAFRAAAGHPVLWISLGIEAARDGESLASVARECAARQEAARRKGFHSGSIDTVDIFGAGLTFDGFEGLQRLAEDIAGLEEPGAARRLLKRLASVAALHGREAQALRSTAPGLSPEAVREAAFWKRWQWSLMAGLQDLAGAPTQARDRVGRIRGWLLAGGNRNIETLPLVLRWAEGLLKGEGR